MNITVQWTYETLKPTRSTLSVPSLLWKRSSNGELGFVVFLSFSFTLFFFFLKKRNSMTLHGGQVHLSQAPSDITKILLCDLCRLQTDKWESLSLQNGGTLERPRWVPKTTGGWYVPTNSIRLTYILTSRGGEKGFRNTCDRQYHSPSFKESISRHATKGTR